MTSRFFNSVFSVSLFLCGQLALIFTDEYTKRTIFKIQQLHMFSPCDIRAFVVRCFLFLPQSTHRKCLINRAQWATKMYLWDWEKWEVMKMQRYHAYEFGQDVTHSMCTMKDVGSINSQKNAMFKIVPLICSTHGLVW